MQVSKCFTLALAFVGLSACGSDSKKSDEIAQKGDEYDSALSGTWLSACTPVGPLGLIPLAGEREEMAVNALTDVTKTVHHFDDKGCASPLYNQAIIGTYAEAGDSDKAAGAKNLNITVHKSTITPVSAAGVANLNDVKLCGATDWQLNVAKDVTGADCGGKSFAEGVVVFDVYKVDGSSLFLGKSSFFRDGSSAEQRPTALDTEHPLAKQ